MPTARTAPLAALAAVALVLLAGCGGVTGSDRPDTRATLLLDFQPNGVHAGIYLAAQRGYDDAEGVALRIRKPGASSDPLKQLETGRADLAVLDIHDLGLARERGADVVGVMALVQQPLAAVLAQPEIRTPRDLEGKRAGVTGLPSDEAVLRSVVEGAGGDPRRVRETTIGFEAVKALLAGRVAAATAFWNVEGVALKARRPGFREFRVEELGAPRYPELVLCVTRRFLEEDEDTIRAVVRALQRGYGEASNDPASAVSTMLGREPSLDPAALAAQVDAVAPAWGAGTTTYGRLDRKRLQAWSAWDVEFGILERPVDLDRAFDLSLVGPVENP